LAAKRVASKTDASGAGSGASSRVKSKTKKTVKKRVVARVPRAWEAEARALPPVCDALFLKSAPELRAVLLDAGGGRLTEKQMLFVLNYVGPACGNRAEAARLAGYADSNVYRAGMLLMKDPAVMRAVGALVYELSTDISLRVMLLKAAFEAEKVVGVRRRIKRVEEGPDGPVEVVESELMMAPDWKARVEFLEKLVAVRDGMRSEETSRPQVQVLVYPKVETAAEMAAMVGDGYTPPKEDG